MLRLATIAFLICLVPLASVAQEDKEEDPFKRDPLFTKPISEFFKSMMSEEESQEDLVQEEDVKRYVRRLNENGLDFDGSIEAGPYYSNPLFSQYPNLPMIHFNRVNGLFLGIKKERMQWHRYNDFLDIPGIRPHGFIGYGTASGNWEYAIGAEKLIGRNNFFMIGGEYHNATATEDYWRVGLIESSFTSFFASYDYPDYYKMQGFGAYMVMRTQRLMEAAISYNLDQFSSVPQNTSYSMFGYSRVYRPNPPIDFSTDQTDIGRLSVGAKFNPRKIILMPYFTFSAAATAEFAGLDGFDNDFSYNKYQFESLIYVNFEPGSLFKWRLKTGGITGNAPYFKQFQLGGIGTLRASPYKSMTGNQMLLSNMEVHFGRSTSGSNTWVDMDSFYLTLFLDSGWTQFNQQLDLESNPFQGFSRFSFKDMNFDGGIGLGSSLIRFELAWPLESFDRNPVLWIRFNPTF